MLNQFKALNNLSNSLKKNQKKEKKPKQIEITFVQTIIKDSFYLRVIGLRECQGHTLRDVVRRHVLNPKWVLRSVSVEQAQQQFDFYRKSVISFDGLVVLE